MVTHNRSMKSLGIKSTQRSYAPPKQKRPPIEAAYLPSLTIF
jgi:hypothetical protein